MSTTLYSALSLLPKARKTITELCSRSDFLDKEYEKLGGDLRDVQKKIVSLSLLGQSHASYGHPKDDAPAGLSQSAGSSAGSPNQEQVNGSEASAQKQARHWADLTERVLASGDWTADPDGSMCLTERDIELLATEFEALKRWSTICSLDYNLAQRHYLAIEAAELSGHEVGGEIYRPEEQLADVKKCLEEMSAGPLMGGIDLPALEADTNGIVAELRNHLSPSNYLYSAFTVFPASFDRLRKADERSPLTKFCGHGSRAIIDVAMHQYESLMVLQLAQLEEERSAMDKQEVAAPELQASADKRHAMISRAATVSAWHKDREASYVFSHEDLRFLKDTLPATDEFLKLCETAGGSTASNKASAAKAFWDKAVACHEQGRENAGASGIESESLQGNARAAVQELLQWSQEQSAEMDGEEYLRSRRDDVNMFLKRRSWPEGRSSTALPTRRSKKKWLEPPNSRWMVHRLGASFRRRLLLARGVGVESPGGSAKTTTSSSEVPQIIVS